MPKIFETPLYPYQRASDQSAREPVVHPVIIVGAGPVGLAAAIDLAMNDVPVLILDENDRVSFGSRAICFAKRTLEIFDRLGCSDRMIEKGVTWNTGKVFFHQRQVFDFNLLPEEGHKHPAFINIQQYAVEAFLVERVRELERAGKPIEIRGRNRVCSVAPGNESVQVQIDTPDGEYAVLARWLIASDGASSSIRTALGLDFTGHVFEDNFLIADVLMDADFPTERWFWFDPPFNRGRSALLHKQPDNLWRIDLQLGTDIDREEEKKPENVIPRLEAMLGTDVQFELEWVSIYTFQCSRMDRFRHDRVLFAGDSAHQVSPFGARGANSGIQDVDNLCWRLKMILDGQAPPALLDCYNEERVAAADENILHSTRSTDFITPKSKNSRLFRDAVLDLSEHHDFARPLVNSGRLSVPTIYRNRSPEATDQLQGPARTRPGASATNAPLKDGWLLDRLGGHFTLLQIGEKDPTPSSFDSLGLRVAPVSLGSAQDPTGLLKERYLGDHEQAVYLVRPDQHIAGRWPAADRGAIEQALASALGAERPR